MRNLYQKIPLFISLLASTSAFAGTNGTLTYGPANISVPTLSGSMLIVLALLMAIVGYRMFKQKSGNGTMAAVLLGIGVLASGSGGIKLISDAYANNERTDLGNPAGGQVVITDSVFNTYTNTSGIALTISSIDVSETTCDNFPDGGPFKDGEECAVNLVLQPSSSCVVDCSSGDK